MMKIWIIIKKKSVYIKFDAPDLYGYIKGKEGEYTIDKVNYVPILVRNEGTKKNTNTKAKLYYLYDVEDVWLFEENQFIILNNFNDKEYNIKFNIEEDKIKLYVNYDDKEEIFEISNNQVIKLKDGIYINIKIGIYNDYEINLIFSKEFNEIKTVDVSDLEPETEEYINIEWTPTKLGSYVLKLFVDDNEDIDLSNNYDYQFNYIQEDAPDLKVDLEYDWNEQFILNEENNITIFVENIGTQLATNNKIELYDIYDFSDFWYPYDKELIRWFDDTEYKITISLIEDKAKISVLYNDINEEFIVSIGETINLKNGKLLELLWTDKKGASGRISNGKKIYEKDIGRLDVNEEFKEDFKWTPDKLGRHILKLFVKTDKDRDLNNNYYDSWIEVKTRGPDLRGDIWLGDGKVNEINKINIGISNIGTEKATNVIANLYDNGILINKTVFDEFDLEEKYYTVDWIPAETGEHNLTLDIKADKDVDLENNKIEIFLYIYETIEANFKIKNYNGDFVKRGLAINEDDKIQYILDSEKIIPIPSYMTSMMITNTSEMQENLGLSEDKDYIFATHFINSIGQENMDVVSEQYGEKEEGNLKLYFIFANKVNWNYKDSIFLFYYKGITNLNPNLNEEILDKLTVYYCTDWNFENKNCDNEWLEAEIGENDYSENIFYISGYVFGEVNPEAFAIGRVIGNKCDECGTGLLNICDEEECISLGDCIYNGEDCVDTPNNFREALRGGLEGLFNGGTKTLSVISNINACLIVKVNDQRTHSYEINSGNEQIFISNSDNLKCDGTEEEDIILSYNKFSGLQDFAQEDSCDILRKTNMDKYHLWESRFIKPYEKEFNINCTPEFEQKYCNFIKQCATQAEIKQINCCLE